MNPHELALWLILGTLTLLATTSIFLPIRGGHGQHAHAGPGTLTVAQLCGERVVLAPTPPKRRVHSTMNPHDTDDADIVWPPEPTPEEPEPTPLEHDLATLLTLPTDNTYTGRHRLDEPHELYQPPQPLELDLAA